MKSLKHKHGIVTYRIPNARYPDPTWVAALMPRAAWILSGPFAVAGIEACFAIGASEGHAVAELCQQNKIAQP